MPPPRKRAERGDPSGEQPKSRYAVSAENRRGPKTLRELRDFRAKMANALAKLDAEVDRAEKHGLKSIQIDGVKKGERAEELLNSFIGKVANGINDALFQ